MSPQKCLAVLVATGLAWPLTSLPAAASGGTDIIARTGTAAPGLDPGALFDRLFGIGTVPSLNDNGDVAFVGVVSGPGVTGATNSGIWVGDSLRVRRGDPVAGQNGVTYTGFGSPAINGSGDIAYIANLSGGTAVNQGVFRNDTLLVRRGDAATGADGTRTFGTFRGSPAINTAGDVAFAADVSPGFWSIWRNDEFIIRGGSTPPSLGAFVDPLYATRLSLNDAGQVAYRAFLESASLSGSAIFVDDRPVLRSGDAAPGIGPGASFAALFSPALNNTGEVTFRADLTLGEAGVTSTNRRGIWQGDRLVVRTGEEAAAVPGARFFDLTDPVVNDGGQVAFGGRIAGDGVALATSRGIWLYGPNGDGLLVARHGDVIGGRTIAETAFSADDAGLLTSPNSLNNFSQFAYLARFTDGSEAVLRFTPQLRWIAERSGAWDDATGWTIAQRPGAVHEVTLAPSQNLTLVGPSAATTVQRLTVGGGSGIATLDLAGADLTSLQRITVQSTGRIVGSGSLQTPILTNFGNLAVGRGETMTIAGAVESIGTIDVIGGRFETTGQLFNAPAGRVLGVDAQISTGGVLNDGQMQLLGNTTVGGNVVNRGEIASGFGQTTYIADLRNDGVITTGFGTTSQILGTLSGTGSFAGPGLVEVLGTLSPGASPGLLSFDGDLGLAPGSTTLMELGGTGRGIGYDAFDVGGTLTLGGLLRVVLIDGFEPGVGDRFDLFRAHAFAGAFEAFDLPAGFVVAGMSGGGFELQVVPLPAGVWLFGTALMGLGLWHRRAKARDGAAT